MILLWQLFPTPSQFLKGGLLDPVGERSSRRNDLIVSIPRKDWNWMSPTKERRDPLNMVSFHRPAVTWTYHPFAAQPCKPAPISPSDILPSLLPIGNAALLILVWKSPMFCSEELLNFLKKMLRSVKTKSRFGECYLFCAWNQSRTGTFWLFSRIGYVQPYHSKDLGESFPLIYVGEH